MERKSRKELERKKMKPLTPLGGIQIQYQCAAL